MKVHCFNSGLFHAFNLATAYYTAHEYQCILAQANVVRWQAWEGDGKQRALLSKM